MGAWLRDDEQGDPARPEAAMTDQALLAEAGAVLRLLEAFPGAGVHRVHRKVLRLVLSIAEDRARR